MRLWSIHPRYLDSKGLTACWREGLLARSVLDGKTKGYRNHPQLIRFKAQADPVGALDSYLLTVLEEADDRGFHFSRQKIGTGTPGVRILVTDGQLAYEFRHLLRKLEKRAKGKFDELAGVTNPRPHPIFTLVSGGIEEWERQVITVAAKK